MKIKMESLIIMKRGRGYETIGLSVAADKVDYILEDFDNAMKGEFFEKSSLVKLSNTNWNKVGHDYLKEGWMGGKLSTAFLLAQSDKVTHDLYIPDMVYGKGNWPSWYTVEYVHMTNVLYGDQKMMNIQLTSLYGMAFQYADKMQNKGSYLIHAKGSNLRAIDYGDKTEDFIVEKDEDEFNPVYQYIYDKQQGKSNLRFILYVPSGFDRLEGIVVPNVEVTDDPEKIFTASFIDNWY